ncbi:MAG: lytic transglycosylase domain-containing protein [Oscillospiraceae bacterium]|nr:lytic transglycosylase domain-containing protein [Oscillospiraceae bacterium]
MQTPPKKPSRKQKRRGLHPAFFVLPLVILFVGIIAILAWPRAQQEIQELRFPLRYEELILHYSEERDLDPFLVKGLIQAESSFRSYVTSPVGASGLMQIMPGTGAWLAERMGIPFEEEYLFDPAYNIRMGTYYLRMLINMFYHVDTALAAYNAGMGNVGNWLQDERYSDDGETLHTIPFTETRNYVERVNRYMEIYRELYG